MPLSQYQKERCLKATNEMLSYSIAKMFAQPVDPVRDSVPNYFDIVSNPMDLGTIRQKLSTDEYSNVTEWHADVELVWSNSFLISNPKSILGMITTEMQSIYRKLSQYITDDPSNDWAGELGSLRDEFDDIMRPIKSARDSSSTRTSSKFVKQQAAVTSPVKKLSKKRGPAAPKVDILKLTRDINSLTEYSHIAAIMETLKKCEPTVEQDSDTVTADLKNCSQTTLQTLREKLDQMFGVPL